MPSVGYRGGGHRGGHGEALLHRKAQDFEVPGIPLEALMTQGMPWATAHLRTCRWPLEAAAEHCRQRWKCPIMLRHRPPSMMAIAAMFYPE